MKKTLRNIARLLIAVITMTAIVSSLSVQGSSTVEGSYWLEFYERIINPLPETVFVGMEYPVPVFKKTAKNIPTHQVNLYTIKEISDPSMLLVDGKPYDKETTEITQNSKLEFTKEGTFTLFHKTYWQWNYTTDPRFYEGQSRGYSGDAQYKVVVKKRNSFTRDINITYDKPFRTGEPFPEFTFDTDEVYVSRAYFEIRGGGAEYNFYPYFGIKGDWHDKLWANGGGLKHVDTIPELYGGEETYVYLWLEPRKTYNFGWKDKDGDLYWSDAVSNVTVNGKKYKASVSNYNDGMILQVAFPVRIEGEVERVEITDLTAPAHEMELDTTATASVGTVTAVRYEKNRNLVTEVKYGDNIGIGVTVKLPEGYYYAKDENVYAVWNGKKSDVRIRTSSMGEDEYIFVFNHTVDYFSEQAYIDGGSVYFTGDARLKVGASVPDIDSIGSDDTGLIYGDPVWTPAHKTFESGQTYTVRIPVELEPGYTFGNGVYLQGSFTIESQYAELRDDNGGYYITATFTPDDIEGQIEKEPDGETEEETGQTGETEEEYFDIEISYSQSRFTLDVGDKATVTAISNLDYTRAENLNVQWYRSHSPLFEMGVAIDGANSLTFTIPTKNSGSMYYFCEISCEVDGKPSRIIAAADPVFVKVRIESNDVTVYKPYDEVVVDSSDEDFSFEMDDSNLSPKTKYKWYKCDKDGNIIDNTVLGDGKALLIYGIKQEDMYKTFYYKCVATDGDSEESSIFSCILLPEKTPIPFTDVNVGDPYYGSVWYANHHTPQLMNGVSEDSFDPMGNLTRAAIVTVLYRLEGSPAVTSGNEFDDVISGEWYADAVAWAVSNGITNGYGDGRFGPGDPITREQLVTFLHRYAGKHKLDTDASGELSHQDAAEVDEWALDAMKWAYSKEIIEAVDGILAPLDNAARHMIATALTRFCVEYSM